MGGVKLRRKGKKRRKDGSCDEGGKNAERTGAKVRTRSGKLDNCHWLQKDKNREKGKRGDASATGKRRSAVRGKRQESTWEVTERSSRRK